MTSNILAKSPLDAVTVYTWSFVFYFSTKNEINFTRGFDKFKEAGPKYEATQVTLGGNTITVTGVQKASLAVTKLHDNTIRLYYSDNAKGRLLLHELKGKVNESSGVVDWEETDLINYGFQLIDNSELGATSDDALNLRVFFQSNQYLDDLSLAYYNDSFSDKKWHLIRINS